MFYITDIYEKYKQDVFIYLIGLTHDHTLSEDLLSETFLAVMKSLPTFKGESSIKTWIFSIARYKWYEHLRKNKNDISFEELADIYFEENIIENSVINKDIVTRIKSILNNENERTKNIVLMRIDGYSYYEISQKYNISENSARVIDFRAKKKIKDILESEGIIYE